MKDIPYFGYSTLPPIREEMQTDMKTDTVHYREDATGHMLCWGCGEFGQHGHGYKKEVSFLEGAVEKFCGAREHQVKHVGCGSSHTAVVTTNNSRHCCNFQTIPLRDREVVNLYGHLVKEMIVQEPKNIPSYGGL